MLNSQFNTINELVPADWYFSVAWHESYRRTYQDDVKERNEWTFFACCELDPILKKRREVSLCAETFEQLIEAVKATEWILAVK